MVIWWVTFASREARDGLGPGPRVRPRLDRWRLGASVVSEARALHATPIGRLPEDRGSVPAVLVTMDRDDEGPYVDAPYVQAICAAGLAPWLVPPGAQLHDAWTDDVVGVVVTGGAFDIPPSAYGMTWDGRLDRTDVARTDLELSLCRTAFTKGLPLLGICGGMQALAVALGGTLIPDLPAEPTHEQPSDPAVPWHDVVLEGALAEVLGDRVRVNSTHHQAVRDPGPQLDVVGRSPDGVIEAVQGRGPAPVWGVQWHPERMGQQALYAAWADATRRLRPLHR